MTRSSPQHMILSHSLTVHSLVPTDTEARVTLSLPLQLCFFVFLFPLPFFSLFHLCLLHLFTRSFFYTQIHWFCSKHRTNTHLRKSISLLISLTSHSCKTQIGFRVSYNAGSLNVSVLCCSGLHCEKRSNGSECLGAWSRHFGYFWRRLISCSYCSSK